MATGLGVMGDLVIMIISLLFSILLLIFNCVSTGILSGDQSWFDDPLSTWLSVNTIVSFCTIVLLFVAVILMFFMSCDLASCSMTVILAFWITKFGMVIWGTVMYAMYNTEHENTRVMALTMIILLWLTFAFWGIMGLRACCARNDEQQV